jgi:signal transduction histidine kinase
MNKLKFTNIFLVLSVLFMILTYIYYNKTREIAIENAEIKINELLLGYKSFRAYVTKVQKPEVFRLTQQENLSCDYFMPQVLSSTFSAKGVNDFYNTYREEIGEKPIKVRYASDNPRNLNNKATPKESKILQGFNDNMYSKFIEIHDGKDGKELYYAVPTIRTTKKCMKCHSDPKLAPKQMVEIYGDKNGFWEKQGEVRALLSTTYPLEDDLVYANNLFLKLLLVTFSIFTIASLLVYLFIKKLDIKKTELEELNKNLDKKVEERTKELEQEREYIKKILDTSPNIVLVTNGKTIIGANRQFFKFFGYETIDEFKKHHNCICDYFKSIDHKSFPVGEDITNKNWCMYLIDKQHEVHHVDIENKGQIYTFMIKASNIEKDEILIILNDITELKRKDKLLFEQSKLASMGEMIGNIAHQWRQPLSIISTSATGLKIHNEYGLVDDKMLNEMCDIIDNNTQYLSRTIDDFKNFIKGENKITEFSLHENINNLITMVSPSAKSHQIKIIYEPKDDIILNGYPSELTQCLINIFNNSKDELEKNDDTNRFFFIDISKDDENAIIKLYDNAGGIPKDILPKIFEPYFTTKHKSQGTGLGLHMTYNLIVDGMHGKIVAQNINYDIDGEKNKGACFSITIPRNSF